VATTENPTIDYNHVDGAFYLDTNFTYKLHTESAGDLQFFLTIQNALDKDPPVVPLNGGLLYAGKPTNVTLYDTLGRTFRAGVRFKM